MNKDLYLHFSFLDCINNHESFQWHVRAVYGMEFWFGLVSATGMAVSLSSLLCKLYYLLFGLGNLNDFLQIWVSSFSFPAYIKHPNSKNLYSL